MNYKWKNRGLGGVKAEVVGRTVERLAGRRGGITPAVLVKEAQKQRSPIHQCFEWDDTEAAKKYRIVQAQYILRQIEIVVEREDAAPLQIRAFHNVVQNDQRFYTTVKAAREDEELWEQVKAKALSEIKNWR